MGVDVIGWRDCALQQPLGTSGFLAKLKMRAYLRAIEAQVPEDQRADVEVEINVNEERRELTYQQIRDEVATFQHGIPDCESCPLSPEGKRLGCYTYVTYPIDELFERLVFEFFCSQLGTPDSISDQIYRDLVSRQPAHGSWHERRGPQGALACRDRVFEATVAGRTVDSGQLLASLFIPLRSPALIVGFSRFWRELIEYCDLELAREMEAHGIHLENGELVLSVTTEQHDDADLLAAKLTADSAMLRGYLSGTLGEIRELCAIMMVAAPRSITDGWSVVIDG